MFALNNQLQPDTKFPYAIAIAAVLGLAAAGGMALLAVGRIDPIQLLGGAPVDAELVLSAFWHALLGSILACLQWGAGAGLALWASGKVTLPIGRLMLLGFPLSLFVVALWSYLVLVLPFGWVPATAALILCFLSFLRRPPAREEFRRLGLVLLSLLPSSVLLGCWMGLLAHGPTATLPGHASGDLSFYASSIYSLQVQPFPFVNYANEGEVLLPFNLLYSMLGAALMRFITMDPFQFVLAAAASIHVLGLGLALHAYLSLRPNTGTGLSYVVLILAALVATRYPYWIVESTPVIFALPLSIAIWYRATAKRSVTGAMTNFILALASSALSKVTTVVTLAPLSLAPLADKEALQQFRRLPRLVRLGIIVIAVVAVSYAAFMLLRFGPYMWSAGGIGPESYERYGWAIQNGLQRRVVLPYMLRDAGTVLLGVLAFRMLPWAFATALAGGLTAALIVPFFLRINLPCAAIIIALAGIDQPLLLRRSRALALTAFLLCLPAILLTDFGGHISGAIWVLCIGSMAWTVCAYARAGTRVTGFFTPRFAGLGILILALVGFLALTAVARQQVSFIAQDDYLRVPPEARDIWTAVRQRTPARALIFTDQTGTEPYNPLGGWNTYATTGQRQIYVAGWYQLPELRQSPQLLMERLRLNQSVLSGQAQPGDLHYRRGPYSDYFAVVSRGRVMPPTWLKTYENGAYVLYRYKQKVGSKV